MEPTDGWCHVAEERLRTFEMSRPLLRDTSWHAQAAFLPGIEGGCCELVVKMNDMHDLVLPLMPCITPVVPNYGNSTGCKAETHAL